MLETVERERNPGGGGVREKDGESEKRECWRKHMQEGGGGRQQREEEHVN